MRQIPVDTSTATVMIAQAPQDKIANRQTKERAVDRETGEFLKTVDVMFVIPGSAPEILNVTVPESAVDENLALGMPVELDTLIARPWENDFNGQKRHGISFRARAVKSVA